MKNTINSNTIQENIASNLSTENFEKHISKTKIVDIEQDTKKLDNRNKSEANKENNLSNLSANSRMSDSRMDRAKSALREASDALKKFKGKTQQNCSNAEEHFDDSTIVKEIQELMDNNLNVGTPEQDG